MLRYDTLRVKYTAADFLETMHHYRSLYVEDRKEGGLDRASDTELLKQRAESEKNAEMEAKLPLEVIKLHPTADITLQEQNALAARLDDAMKNQQMFLNSDLTLDDLSRTLHTNRSYLSRLINTTHNHSFSTYINCFRINYAKDLMQKEDSATLDWVALQSGFLSYNTFYHTFMEFEGMSPGKWRKLLKVEGSGKAN
jgi:YesN/AraC family two-component response regulator